jgi:(heptosyl)LPS beta-1,4-glucosyltransferase
MTSNQPHRLPITAVIIARDEAHRISRCLEALDWLQEIILFVDNRTTDETASIAARFHNVAVKPSQWLGFGPTKAAAIEAASHEWIFWIDADEVVTDTLRKEIQNAFSAEKIDALPDAFDLPRLPWFINDWIHHCGWYPGRVVRLFRRGHGHFSNDAVHESVILEPNSRIMHLQADLLHYSYDTPHQFFEKMVRYGPLGADAAIQRGKKCSIFDIVLRPFYTFFRFYFLRRGFLDGVNGFIVCAGSGFSTFIRYVHLFYLQRSKLDSPDETKASQ